MKKVLSLLLAFVFLHTQAHALSGGPVFGTQGTSIIGTYSGVLTGPPNALGIFVVGVKEAGPATGDFNIFIGGTFYGGSIIGIGDPLDSSFQGVLQATLLSDFSTFSSIFSLGSVTTGTVQGTAAGLVNATIGDVGDAGGFSGSLSNTRLTGTATVDVRERQPDTERIDPVTGATSFLRGRFKKVASLEFLVDGFKQSPDGNAGQQAALLNSFGGGGGAVAF